MRSSFLHLADMRLGATEQGDLAADVAAKRFRFAIDFAIDQRTSFVLFSGNLFDSPALHPESLHVVLRGLSRLAEKNITAVAIRGRREVSLDAISGMSWHDLLARDGMLATLEVQIGDGRLELAKWERRNGAGSYLDVGRCRIFGLRYVGSMIGPMIQALAKAIGALDNREADLRIVLLNGPLEQANPGFNPSLSNTDRMLLRRHADYLALGGADDRYEADDYAYNPGRGGFYHVMVDTAVQPKFSARYVPYPAGLAPSQPAVVPAKPARRDLEARILGELVNDADNLRSDLPLREDELRLVVESMWRAGDPLELEARLLEAAQNRLERQHDL